MCTDFSYINMELINVGEVHSSCEIDSKKAARFKGANYKIEMTAEGNIYINESTISLSARCSYLLNNGKDYEKVFSCTAIAWFRITDLEQYVEYDGKVLRLNKYLGIRMLDTLVGALRGIISVRTSETPLKSINIPIINWSDFVQIIRLNFIKSDKTFSQLAVLSC